MDSSSNMLGALLQQAGGLQGLMEKFGQAGLGDQFSSWVSQGENQAISGDQLKSALGGEVFGEASKKMGLDLGALMPMAAKLLPELINQLTPQGKIEGNEPSEGQIKDVVGNLLKNGLSQLM